MRALKAVLVGSAVVSMLVFSTPAGAGMVASPKRDVSSTTDRLAGADLARAVVQPDAGARAGQFEFVVVAVVVVVFIILLIALSGSSAPAEEPPPPPPPIKDDVPPIRNQNIRILVTTTFTYTPRDATLGRDDIQNICVDVLNEEGQADGNTFKVASGEAHNFNFDFTIHCDEQNRFTGSVNLSGWGWGHIQTFSHGEYSYSNGYELIEDLTAKAYNYIHTGWRDARKQ